ncbi:MAG: hypothetical protein EOO50_15760 [Flavobacterium sp.]|uniref:hypothetical protein n=1 Tax=Flavobacterium sp. TaxID=239 RepID=UPI001227236F|nr:hypothetical protein [Flavobacterium sp.]RZJ64411.1 MAG: hypothetical protein EOO50_15760 [Flavobacterium sp.]
MSRIFEKFTEVIGWLQIVASPLLIGFIIGAIIYFSNANIFTLIIAVIIILFSLLVGIYFATKIARKKGTISFLSQISATPDIDEWIKNKSKEEKE